jgi:superfamily II DNA or RNA helicase
MSPQAGLRPRPHQVAALAGIARVLAAWDRAQLVSACGTGKTLTGRWHAQAAGSRITVVFVPSLALVAQTLGEWRRAGDPHWPYEALVVCSDPSTAAGAAERAADEGGNVGHDFWSRVHSRVTTSPGVAAAALRRAQGVRGGRLVVFSTYHSAPVVAAACKASGAVFDLMICDEAHRLAGRPRDAFRAVLRQKGVPARKRLFMTATAQVLDGDDVLSMDDEATFGPVAHAVTFAQAIQEGLLCDYQVLVIAGHRVQDGRERRSGHDAMAVPGAVLAAASDHHLRSLLSFHTYVKDATAFAGLLDGATLRNGRVIRARHVSARHLGVQRARALAWLGEDSGGRELRLVSSSRCLTEGVDVPGVDGILFADPRKAVIGIIQSAGRALRAAPGKKVATIIIPVTLPDGGGSDDDTDLLVSEFGHVWTVLRALRAHDERFAAEIDEAAAGVRGRPGRAARPALGRGGLSRVRFLLPGGVKLDEDLLRLRMVEAVTSDSSWERFYALLCDHAEATGGAFLPFNETWKGAGLGKWAHRQVTAYKKGLLPAVRKARLEAVPGWAWSQAGRHQARGRANARPRRCRSRRPGPQAPGQARAGRGHAHAARRDLWRAAGSHPAGRRRLRQADRRPARRLAACRHHGDGPCRPGPHRKPRAARDGLRGDRPRRPHQGTARQPRRPRVRHDLGCPRARLFHQRVPRRQLRRGHPPGSRAGRRPARAGRRPGRAEISPDAEGASPGRVAAIAAGGPLSETRAVGDGDGTGADLGCRLRYCQALGACPRGHCPVCGSTLMPHVSLSGRAVAVAYWLTWMTVQ